MYSPGLRLSQVKAVDLTSITWDAFKIDKGLLHDARIIATVCLPSQHLLEMGLKVIPFFRTAACCMQALSLLTFLYLRVRASAWRRVNILAMKIS